MSNTIKLIKYHVILFIAFALLVLTSFYIIEGGDLDTPLILILYYFTFSTLAYLPLLLVLTTFNFIILVIGFNAFTGKTERALISFLPVVLFWLWFSFLPTDSVLDQYSLTKPQFALISGTWSFLVTIGMIANSETRRYVPLALLPVIVFSIWFLLKDNFAPSNLMLTDFQYKCLLAIWATLNCCIFVRYKKKITHEITVSNG